MTSVRRWARIAGLLCRVRGMMVYNAKKNAASPTSAVNGEWRGYGGDKGFQRYSPLDQINRDNVKDLQVVWARPSIDAQFKEAFPDLVASNYLRGTPIMVDGVLYVANGVALLEAFDATTGKTKWVQKPFPKSLKEAAGQSVRGVE